MICITADERKKSFLTPVGGTDVQTWYPWEKRPSGGVMRIVQVGGSRLMAEDARRRLESIVFRSSLEAARGLQRCFPHHVVYERGDRIQVAVRDRSFVVADFKPVL
jgi:hypothetical protein